MDKLPQPRDTSTQLLEELRALRREQAATARALGQIHNLLDDFFRVYLSSKFRYGKANDRFSRPPTWSRS